MSPKVYEQSSTTVLDLIPKELFGFMEGLWEYLMITKTLRFLLSTENFENEILLESTIGDMSPRLYEQSPTTVLD